jgi:hypothetical protein
MDCGMAEEGTVVDEFYGVYFYDFHRDMLLKDLKVNVPSTMLLLIVRN